MKIGDLWVKLGLKKDEFSKGMKQADGEVKSLAGGMRSMSAIGMAAWAAVSAAVVKFAKDAISMTQKWGDSWNQTMAGIKGAYSSFVRQISSGDGWNNLFDNMREAYRVSKEVAAALDEIFERKVSFSYQEAETEKQIAQQQLIARDSSKSEAERIAANKKIIELTDTLGKAKKAIYEDEAAQHRKLFASQTHLNDEQIDFLVKEYNQNRAVIQQAREYLKTKKELSKQSDYAFGSTLQMGGMPAADYSMAGKSWNDAQQALLKLESETPQAIKDVAALTQAYDKANDDLVKGMADAEVAVIRIDTETMHAQTRATALLGTLNRTSGGGSGEDPRLKEAERIQQRLAQYGKSELQLLREKYNQEKALLEALGIDTTVLAEEYSANIKKILDVPLKAAEKLDDIVVDLSFEIDPADDPVAEVVAKWEEDVQRMQDIIADFRDAAIQGMSDAIQELADQFAGLEEINPGKVVQALLTPLADMAIKEGELLIAKGIGIEAVKKALISLNGIPAIAAGTALVAIGAAAKSGLASLARSGSSTATTSYASAGSSAAQTQTIQTEMTVYVTGRLSGSDILLSGQKTQSNWNR